MAAYPALRVLRPSTAERQGGQEPQRATNGALKMRRLYSAEKTDFVIEHALSEAEKAALEAFYQTNRDLAVDFVWPEDTVSYSVLFAGPPQYLRRVGWWEARVTLMQV
jgi:hypothetical protein